MQLSNRANSACGPQRNHRSKQVSAADSSRRSYQRFLDIDIYLYRTHCHQSPTFVVRKALNKAPVMSSFSSWASTIMQVKLSYRYFFLLLLPIIVPHRVTAIVHDDSFSPDAILRVTMQNVSIGGIHRLTALVNGSIPGPELRVPENETAWIRVYNDMNGQNLTMVSRFNHFR